jgi:hypothetical protein
MQPLKRVAPMLVIHLLVQQRHRKDFLDEDSGAVGVSVGHKGEFCRQRWVNDNLCTSLPAVLFSIRIEKLKTYGAVAGMQFAW